MHPATPFALLALVALSGCKSEPAGTPDADASALSPYQTRTWQLPVEGHAAQPDLILAPDGDVLLSWIEPDASAPKSHVLKFARFADDRWSEPQTIARGDDWFVNWADTPHIAATADGALWAHWLQKSSAATYSYDVALVRSGDGGSNWSAPVLVNDDGTPTEHGFVSLWAASSDSLGIAWLDGRRTASGGGHDAPAGHDAHAAGTASEETMMTLRTTVFDAALQRGAEHELDVSTCDCCQTDAVATPAGAMLAYRDRTAAEIRDINVARFQDGAWQPVSRVHADDWTMPACPVNGPAIHARGSDAIVGWYTAPDGTPMVKLAHSGDSGASFAEPRVIDGGDAVQGRVAVALGETAAWVLWLRETDAGQSLQLALFSPDLARELQRIEVATLQGRGRGTGFPQMVLSGDTAHVIWTDVVDGKPALHGARIEAPKAPRGKTGRT
ncbi:MAG: glycoside hydrolase [Pseudomonadota bacterium]|nr:glycoside hydrolase [Pseudomonadota bacterium]